MVCFYIVFRVEPHLFQPYPYLCTAYREGYIFTRLQESL